MGRCEWHAEGSAQSIATPPATISGWKLAKASLLGGGSAGTAYAAAGAPIVLRHREPASLQLHVQVAESQPDGSVKTVAASAKSKLSPVLLMQVCASVRAAPATISPSPPLAILLSRCISAIACCLWLLPGYLHSLTLSQGYAFAGRMAPWTAFAEPAAPTQSRPASAWLHRTPSPRAVKMSSAAENVAVWQARMHC